MAALDESKATPMRCPDGFAHVWTYLGKPTQRYACSRCAHRISKQDLQEASRA